MGRRFLFTVAGVAALWIGALGIELQVQSDARSASPDTRGPNAAPSTNEKRFVSPAQLAASGSLANRPITPFTAVTGDGQAVTWSELSEGKPLVLVFIKQGCPCSIEFQPCFHRLEEAYRDYARFVGVIDGPVDAAREFAATHVVPYPILADENLELISKFQARNGAYVALVSAEGHLETLWPGCSVEMIEELGRQISRLAGVEVMSIDHSGLPHALTTGCPFSL